MHFAFMGRRTHIRQEGTPPPQALHSPRLLLTAETPDASSPYCVALSAKSDCIAAGLADGTLVFFTISAENWKETHRVKRHSAELQCLAFAADGTGLCSSADDGLALFWDVTDLTHEPYNLPLPPLRWHALTSPAKSRRRQRKSIGRPLKWRFAHPLRKGKSGYSVVGAANHCSGSSWIILVVLQPGTEPRVAKVAKASNNRVTAFAATDSSVSAIGTSEGEVVLFSLDNLQRLSCIKPHEMFVTALCLIDTTTKPRGKLQKLAAIACSGENSCKVITFNPETLNLQGASGKFFSIAVSIFIALIAILAARPEWAVWFKQELLGVRNASALMAL